MDTAQPAGAPRLAAEITATLAGRRFGLFGFDAAEAARISEALQRTASFATRFPESWLVDFAHGCDAAVVKLDSITPDGLRAALSAPTPVLIAGASESVLAGASAAYYWAGDFLGEPWGEAELLVRLFRLVAPERSCSLKVAVRLAPLVLIADDDPAMVALVEATLKNHGLACHATGDGLAALRLVRDLMPDVVVLDIKMPGMDGFEVLEAVRREPFSDRLRVLLLTGCDDSSAVQRGSALRADGYLVKPLSPIVLLNRIKRLLAAPGYSGRRDAPRESEAAPPALLPKGA